MAGRFVDSHSATMAQFSKMTRYDRNDAAAARNPKRAFWAFVYGGSMVFMIGIQLHGGVDLATLPPQYFVSGGVSRQATVVDAVSVGSDAEGAVYQLAYDQSFGFFDTIHQDDWKLYQKRARNASHHKNPDNPIPDYNNPAMFYLNNYEPTFSCPHLRRIGGMGDGPKWVCDPHRLHRIEAERRRAAPDDPGPHCLIYSVGSHGEYAFENGLLAELLGTKCHIHIFDIDDYWLHKDMAKINVFFHQWGLHTGDRPEPTVTDTDTNTTQPKFMSLPETMKVLGHENRTIDIFKVDCEGCEYVTYKDWMDSADIRQILVETHFLPPPERSAEFPFDVKALDYYNAFEENGYVLFNKEINIHPNAKGTCTEWSYVKLHPNFLHGTD
jgi:hypothetical protein